MALKLLFLPQNHRAAGGSALLWHAWVASVSSARDQNKTHFVQKTFIFGSSPLTLNKTLVALLVAFTSADRFFKRLNGPNTKRANKRCRANTLLISNMNKNCSFKLSVFMCKSSIYFSALTFSAIGPPHFVCFATALLVACGYLVPTIFIETREKNLVIRLVIWMFFLPSIAFAFSCLQKKIVFLEYLVVSGNTDCALLFDGFSL